MYALQKQQETLEKIYDREVKDQNIKYLLDAAREQVKILQSIKDELEEFKHLIQAARLFLRRLDRLEKHKEKDNGAD